MVVKVEVLHQQIVDKLKQSEEAETLGDPSGKTGQEVARVWTECETSGNEQVSEVTSPTPPSNMPIPRTEDKKQHSGKKKNVLEDDKITVKTTLTLPLTSSPLS